MHQNICMKGNRERERDRDRESAHLCKRDYGERIGDLQIITRSIILNKSDCKQIERKFPNHILS